MPLEHLKQAMFDITISIRPILRAETQHIMTNRTVAVVGKHIWGAWPLIIWEASTAKRNNYRTN